MIFCETHQKPKLNQKFVFGYELTLWSVEEHSQQNQLRDFYEEASYEREISQVVQTFNFFFVCLFEIQ